jgi:hypothetical protein
MDENIKNTYNRIKWVIWEDKILNHYVNNFSQHIYFTEIRKERNILYKYLLNVSETLEAPNNKKMFYFYLKDSYKNKNFGALEVIKSYYK